MEPYCNDPKHMNPSGELSSQPLLLLERSIDLPIVIWVRSSVHGKLICAGAVLSFYRGGE